LKANWFDNVSLDSKPPTFSYIAIPRRNGEHDHGNILRSWVGLDFAQDFEAAFPGQIQIQ
jgi:hypothetical protein